MGLFTGIFHVCLFCENINKSAEFYKNLDCEQLFYMKEKDGDRPWNYYFKVSHGQYIELQPVNSENPHPHPSKAIYYDNQTVWHFSLETDNMVEVVKVLNDRGIKVFTHPEEGAKRVYTIEDVPVGGDGCLTCWIYDPDGTPIELMEQVGMTLQRQYDIADTV